MRILLVFLISINLWAYEDFVKQAYHDSYNYEKMQNYADSIKSMQVVYARYPKAYTPNYRLGWLFFLNKNYANSISHYEIALGIVPGSTEAKLGLIQVFQAQGKYDDAKRLIYNILQSDLYNYYANSYLIDVLNAKQEYEQSLKIIYKMLASYPTDISFLSQLAQVYVRQNKDDLATSIYTDVLILDPSNPAAIGYLNRKK